MSRYEPITKDQIRLLQIHPLSQSQNESRASTNNIPIQCALITVAKDHAPPFRALSYTWGDDKDLVPVYINDQTCLVTRNLFHALGDIRDEKETITIWNDATCINQEDDLEKSEQVRHMDAIYSSAFETIVWLGPAADGSDEFIQRCNKIAKKLWELEFIGGEGDKISFLELMGEFGHPKTAGTSEKTSHSYLGQPVLDVLSGLFEQDENDIEAALGILLADNKFARRGYWIRVWIRQEFIVSRELRLLCGRSAIGFEELRSVMFYLQLMQFQLISKLAARSMTIWDNAAQDLKLYMSKWVLAQCPGEDLDGGNEDSSVKEYKYLRRSQFKISNLPPTNTLGVFGLRSLYHSADQERKQDIFTLWRMVIRFHVENTVGVTKDRDRIFAFLSMATDKHQLKIETTYAENRSDDEIYCETARSIIATGDVDLLSFAQHKSADSERKERLPSWVPDWRYPLVRPCGQLPWDTTFKVSAEKAFHWINRSVEDQSTISLSGWIVDTIEKVSTPWRPPTMDFAGVDEYPKIVQFLREIKTMCKLSDDRFHSLGADVYTTDPIKERGSAYFIVPVADQERYSTTTIGRATEESRESHARVLEGIACGALSHETIDYVSRMSCQKFRRPFLSFKGYVGLAPDLTLEGDVVVIFAGAKFPYVLRKNEDESFRLVGEAYVHGIMYGEFLREDREERLFVLR